MSRQADPRLNREPWKDEDGYWITKTNGRIRRVHRAVYERFYGPIPDGWHVHHVNGRRDDNDPWNLRALSPGDHRRLHDALRRAARQAADPPASPPAP
ncbi:MAG: HNH endonuclease [Gemmataceae bacterium]|nr:HNH endonuclease [Gemmataceae bacterium]